MSKKMKMTITFIDEDGEEIVRETVTKEVPFLKEIERDGFRKAFDDYETAVLEGRKEVCDRATEKYFEKASKKN